MDSRIDVPNALVLRFADDNRDRAVGCNGDAVIFEAGLLRSGDCAPDIGLAPGPGRGVPLDAPRHAQIEPRRPDRYSPFAQRLEMDFDRIGASNRLKSPNDDPRPLCVRRALVSVAAFSSRVDYDRSLES